MFGWAISFLVIAIVSGVFGFTGLAGAAVSLARFLFGAGLLMFVVLLAWGAIRDRKLNEPAQSER